MGTLTPKQLKAIEKYMERNRHSPWPKEVLVRWFLTSKVFDEPEELWQESMYEAVSYMQAKLDFDRVNLLRDRS